MLYWNVRKVLFSNFFFKWKNLFSWGWVVQIYFSVIKICNVVSSKFASKRTYQQPSLVKIFFSQDYTFWMTISNTSVQQRCSKYIQVSYSYLSILILFVICSTKIKPFVFNKCFIDHADHHMCNVSLESLTPYNGPFLT